MTKPHTTFSEAVRALELPTPTWARDHHGETETYTADEVRALITAIADMVEQHEAQEPVLKARQEGRMEALAIILHQDAESPFNAEVICGPNDDAGDYSTYWNEEALRKLLHIDNAAYNAFDKAEEQYWDYRGYAIECEIAENERRLAQPTLEATQAGDAKDAARYRWLTYAGWIDDAIMEAHGIREGISETLDAAIDAAMSPTTTRSE